MSDAVIIVHMGRRLAICSSHSRAMRVLHRYPKDSVVIRVRDGAHLCYRVSPLQHLKDINILRMIRPAKAAA